MSLPHIRSKRNQSSYSKRSHGIGGISHPQSAAWRINGGSVRRLFLAIRSVQKRLAPVSVNRTLRARPADHFGESGVIRQLARPRPDRPRSGSHLHRIRPQRLAFSSIDGADNMGTVARRASDRSEAGHSFIRYVRPRLFCRFRKLGGFSLGVSSRPASDSKRDLPRAFRRSSGRYRLTAR